MSVPAVVETPQAAEPTWRTRSRKGGRRIAKAALVALVGYYLFCITLLVVYRFAPPPISSVQLQRRVEALLSGERYTVNKKFVAYSRLPEHVSQAVVAAEDGRFWRHHGFDFTEMRAASKELLDGDLPRGASTITQQLMKNLFGSTSRNPLRKVYDAALTPPAELILGKRRILELYLNIVEWGPGVFGIEEAAQHHYGTSARHLSRSQAAALAALLPNPLRRTTTNTPEYRAEILRRMSARGW